VSLDGSTHRRDSTTITSPWTPFGGICEVTATATNSNGSSTDTVTITVGTPTTTPTFISNSVNNGKTWTAEITRSDGATLSGTWSDGSCCSQPTCGYSGIAKKTASVTFTTDGESITILKP
jgi:hypothetical protein